MACRISELVLECRGPEVLASFWCEVLDYVVLGRDGDGSIEIGPTAGFGGPQPTIILSPADSPSPAKPRLHIDVNATDRDQNAELERLLALGARPADIGQTGQESWHVLMDPEGNEFCLLKARLDPLRSLRCGGGHGRLADVGRRAARGLSCGGGGRTRALRSALAGHRQVDGVRAA